MWMRFKKNSILTMGKSHQKRRRPFSRKPSSPAKAEQQEPAATSRRPPASSIPPKGSHKNARGLLESPHEGTRKKRMMRMMKKTCLERIEFSHTAV